MRVLFLTNNPEMANPLIEWLGVDNEVKISSNRLADDILEFIHPDVVVSYGYRHLIKQPFLDMFDGRIFNLHISMLPYNRGADPNAWSFLDNTPKGVTIHRVDSGLDTGPIVDQIEVTFDERNETLGGTYIKLHAEIQGLFRRNWTSIKDGNAPRIKAEGKGTLHFAKEFSALKQYLLGVEGWSVPIPLFRQRYEAIKNFHDRSVFNSDA